MKMEDQASSLAALAGQTIIFGDIAGSDIRQAMEMDIPEKARALLKHADECLGVLMRAAAQTQTSGEVDEMAA
jgi:hypothetical protein